MLPRLTTTPDRRALLERLVELSEAERLLAEQRQTALNKGQLEIFFYFNERCGACVFERAHIHRQLTGGSPPPELSADLELWLEEARKELEMMHATPRPCPSPAEGGGEKRLEEAA